MKYSKSLFTVLLTFICVFNTFSQLPKIDFDNEILRLDNAIQSKNNTLILREVDSLQSLDILSKTQSAILSTFKLQVLSETWKLDQAMELATELHSQNSLSEKYKVRVWLIEALILEIHSDFSSSLNQLDKVELYFGSHPKDQYYGIFLYRKSSLFRVSGNKKEALPLAYEAKKFGETNGYGDVVSTAIFLIDRMTESDDYEQRLENLELAKKNYETISNYDGIAHMLRNIAQIHSDNGAYNKAKKALFESLSIQKTKVMDTISMFLIHDQLSHIYETQKQYDSAFYYAKINRELDVRKKLADQRDSYLKLEQAKESLRIEFEEKQYAVRIENIKKDRTQLIYVLGLLGALITLLVISWHRIVEKNKENKKQKNEISDQNKVLNNTLSERNVLLSELNHRVKNNLALIVSLVNFHANETDDNLSQTILKNLENRERTIAKAHEQFSYRDIASINDKIELETYLYLVLEGPIHTSNRAINYSIDVKGIALNMDTLLPVGILINELVNNSIKHAVSNELVLQLVIKCDIEHNRLLLHYSDSGTTFIEKPDSKQLGLFIIESMVQQLNGSFFREQSNYHFTLNLKKND